MPDPSPPDPSMVTLTARVNSFKRDGKNKRQHPWPFSKSESSYLDPNTMAEAGFYYDPTTDDPEDQTCKCYLCGITLSGWEENDDPFAEQAKRAGCAWADMVCSVRQHHNDFTNIIFDTPGSLPNSAVSTKVRLETFKNLWPHKGRGWLPTAKKVAAAGFVFLPEDDANDQVTCPYCEYTLSGWEASDDPFAIHQKKKPHCLFFTAEVTGGPSEGSSKTKAGKATTSKRSKKANTAAESQSEAEATQPEEAEEPPAALAKSTRRGRKPKARDSAVTTVSAAPTEQEPESKSTSARGRKKKVIPEETAVEEEAEVVEDEAMLEVSEVDATEMVEEEEEVPRKKGRGRPKGTTAAKDKAPPKPRGRPKKKPAEEVVSEPEDVEVEAEEEEEEADDTIIAPVIPEPSSKSSKASKSTSSKPSAPSGAPLPATSSTLSEAPESSSQPSRPTAASRQPVPRSVSSRSNKPTAPSPELSPPPKAAARGKRTSVQPKSAPVRAAPVKGAPSELERFANLPPTSPAFLDPGITPKAVSAPAAGRRTAHVSTKPTKPSPRTRLPKEVLDQSLTSGANEARKVMDDLILNSPWKPLAPEEEERQMRLELTEEQKRMTLGELMKEAMSARKELLQKEGLAMIGAWEAKTREARGRLEGL